ncbi:uncharacterized protein LOC143301769 [Babylonia areolata]|uniref:uncharacterized protein LOC143301769 n=1 Tax=Babylonia areolata TaxID=304850 RepID=UPI003FD408DF
MLAEIVVAPPPTFLQTFAGRLSKPNVSLAADYCCMGEQPHTLSPEKVKDIGAHWIIVGRGERRKAAKERCKEETGDQIRAALDAGLNVMVCVGETLQEKELSQTQDVLHCQMQCIADNVEDWSRVVVVYQPLWALYTCKRVMPFEVQLTHKDLRNWLADNLTPSIARHTRIIFGGFVSGNHSSEMAIKEDIDGFLEGDSYLSNDFLRIVNARK